MTDKVTLEFSARRRSLRRFRDRREVGRFFACDLYRVVAEGGNRRRELVCELARFDRNMAGDLEARVKFWGEVTRALTPYLGEMGDGVRGRVLDQLARWVAPLTDDEIARSEEREAKRRAALSRLPSYRPMKKS